MTDILNYINGHWVQPSTADFLDVINPATSEAQGRTPLSGQAEVAAAAKAAAAVGASIPVDGRGALIKKYEAGSFVRPTILVDTPRGGEIVRTEVFGPVLSVLSTGSLEKAIALVNSGQYGNQASLFTASGAAARQFRYAVEAGNVGINIGVAAPMAFFPFSGWKESFFGDLHAQGMDAVEFFTQKKVVIERWPKGWTRKF